MVTVSYSSLNKISTTPSLTLPPVNTFVYDESVGDLLGVDPDCNRDGFTLYVEGYFGKLDDYATHGHLQKAQYLP